jgi:succinoglycan biosynthesis protein ExoM
LVTFVFIGTNDGLSGTGPFVATAATGRDVACSKVVLCVLTFQRPVGLRRTLEGIAKLDLPVDKSAELEVIVVDNDRAGSAREVVAGLQPAYPWPLEYAVQPDRGIPQARNRAVALTKERDGDLLAFIDDDEVPESDWLVRSLESGRRTGADVVMGRATPVFETRPPQWIINGHFFERVRFDTDERIRWNYARSSGVLIATKALSPLDSPFDERLRLTGGSDTRLFQRIETSGGKIVWADDAVVLDYIPEAKASWRWLVQRAYRVGNNRTLFLLYFEHPGLFRKVKRFGAGMYHALLGLAEMVVSIFHGRVALVRGAQQVAIGVGTAVGVLGVEYEEYRRVKGR